MENSIGAVTLAHQMKKTHLIGGSFALGLMLCAGALSAQEPEVFRVTAQAETAAHQSGSVRYVRDGRKRILYYFVHIASNYWSRVPTAGLDTPSISELSP